MMRGHRIRSTAAMLLLGVAACSSPPSTTLTLDVAPPAAAAVRANYAGPPIAIPAVHVPAAVDRVEFVRQVAAGQMQVNDFARWAAPLGTLARDALVRDLSARLPSGRVFPPAATVPPGRGVILDVTILSLDSGEGSARMQAAFRRVPGGAVQTVTLEAVLADGRPVSAANAFSVLLGQLSDRIITTL